MIKAAFVGSHSTGKTTLMNGVAELYMGVPTITEIARGFGKIPERGTPAFTKWQWAILEEQVAHERIYDKVGFISDRSTLDNLAYYSLGNTDDKYTEERYRRRALGNISNYTHLFYVPIEFPLVDDGYRDMSNSYQSQIDTFITQKIAQHHMDVIVVTGSIEERIATVNHHLQRWLEGGN